MRIGSLFSGYGGLDLAALELFPGSQVWWHCEWDDAPSKILDHHYPGVPNYRDVTTVDWEQLPAIDILTGGYPCQPFSAAGQRKGIDDERHLWPYVRQAIRVLRPRFTLLENVAGHRSMGFDRVLGDCAEDGLHVRWTSLRAADVGAAHGRERLFILVTDTRHGRVSEWTWSSGRESRERSTIGRLTRRDSEATPDPTSVGRARCVESRQVMVCDGSESTYDRAGRGMGLLPTPTCNDARNVGGPSRLGRNSPGLSMVGRLLPTPEAKLASSGPDYARMKREGSGGHDLSTAIAIETDWGSYAEAIRRHESVLGRLAPSPTELNSKGNPRLSAPFVEWLMMLPAGWVTDVPGLSRNQMLKALGNGVVPAQAVAAFSDLLSWSVAA